MPIGRNTVARSTLQAASTHSNVGVAPRPGLTLQAGAPPGVSRTTGVDGSKAMSFRVPMTSSSPGSRLTAIVTCPPGTPSALPMVISGFVPVEPELVAVGEANTGGVRVRVAVRLAVKVRVMVGVTVAVAVSVGRVGVAVRVSVGVGVMPTVGVSVGGGVAVTVAVSVGVRVTVGVSDGGITSTTSTAPLPPAVASGWFKTFDATA
ncbi:MAG: hypothetical protein AB7V27_03695 [Candidatus Binatia bacterium]